MARPSVRLKKDLARSIKRGHPWVYRDALAAGPDAKDGALVEVLTKDGRYLATGFWTNESPIAVRIVSLERRFDFEALLAERLEAALALRLGRLDLSATNAFRWVHGEADRLPGVHIDVYADVAAVRFDGRGARAAYAPLAALLQAARGVTIRRVIDRETRSEDAEIEVLENGIRFGVDLAHGQKGGLFLDQRANRAEVRARARDRSVLNLFGYTGAFSLYAVAGGARRTDTVDQARPAIASAVRNFERNGFSTAPDVAGFHAVDAFEYLERARRSGARFDLVISDPPAFARSRAGLETALRAYRRLHGLVCAVVAPGGILCAASCSSQVGRADFVDTVEAGARAAGRRFELEFLRGAGFDHPVVPTFPEGDYLKFALGRVV